MNCLLLTLLILHFISNIRYVYMYYIDSMKFIPGLEFWSTVTRALLRSSFQLYPTSSSSKNEEQHSVRRAVRQPWTKRGDFFSAPLFDISRKTPVIRNRIVGRTEVEPGEYSNVMINIFSVRNAIIGENVSEKFFPQIINSIYFHLNIKRSLF